MADAIKEAEKDIKKAEKEIKTEEKKLEKGFNKFSKKIKSNPWLGISVILAVILIVVVVWPSGISETTAGQKIMDFAKERGVDANLTNVESQGSLYKVTLSIQGQEVPVYITKDGKYFTSSAVELAPSTATATGQAVADTPKDVPKSDKPKVEAFVFSYCPYGLQFEKALIPAYNLLKNKVDINIVFIGAMHGIHEENESLRQIAIQQIYGKDKLFAYLAKFSADTKIGDCNADQTCSYPLVKTIMSSLGIDAVKVNAYMVKDAPALYASDQQRASSLGISGSPDFVINGAELSVGRNPEAIKQAICDAFTTAPSECSQTLSTASASAWFGADAGSASSTAAQC